MLTVGNGGYTAINSDRNSFTIHEIIDGGKTLIVSYDYRQNNAVWPAQEWVTEPNTNPDSMFSIHLCNRGKKKGQYTSNGKVSGETFYIGNRLNNIDPSF